LGLIHEFRAQADKGSSGAFELNFDFIVREIGAEEVGTFAMCHFLHDQSLKSFLDFEGDALDRLEFLFGFLVDSVDDFWRCYLELVALSPHFLQQDTNMSIYIQRYRSPRPRMRIAVLFLSLATTSRATSFSDYSTNLFFRSLSVFFVPSLPANGEVFTLIDRPRSGGSILMHGIIFYGYPSSIAV
jgi:hypothetical protein